MSDPKPTAPAVPAAISGIDVMRGVGAVRAKGFWADAWERVLSRRGAVFGISWISVVAFFAVFAPFVANAHPYTLVRTVADGSAVREWPLLANLTPTDILLVAGALVGLPWVFLGTRALSRAQRLGMLVVAALQCGAVVVLGGALLSWAQGADRAEWLKDFARGAVGPWVVVGGVSAVVAALAVAVPSVDSLARRLAAALAAGLLATIVTAGAGGASLVNFERYVEDERTGAVRDVVWAPIPWSPQYTRSDMVAVPPGTQVGDWGRLAEFKGTPFGERRVLLGTDALGGDVLSQLMWACRLSISIGIVSTGISVVIGVTVGAVMGYFGGKVDLLLFRVVEIFMAVPVLFLLIVAAGVLPRDTYVMMAIIGCFSWTGAARFTRAEFLKLRNQPTACPSPRSCSGTCSPTA
jgi:ABC-type dipeptide/oligopeptide/nickel transport system permease subunit